VKNKLYGSGCTCRCGVPGPLLWALVCVGERVRCEAVQFEEFLSEAPYVTTFTTPQAPQPVPYTSTISAVCLGVRVGSNSPTRQAAITFKELSNAVTKLLGSRERQMRGILHPCEVYCAQVVHPCPCQAAIAACSARSVCEGS